MWHHLKSPCLPSSSDNGRATPQYCIFSQLSSGFLRPHTEFNSEIIDRFGGRNCSSEGGGFLLDKRNKYIVLPPVSRAQNSKNIKSYQGSRWRLLRVFSCLSLNSTWHETNGRNSKNLNVKSCRSPV